MVEGFDMASAVKSTIQDILQLQDLPLCIYTDSRSLYKCLVKLSTTAEKRLMVDVMALRQAYERREIMYIVWINAKSNVADALTKHKANTALKKLIDTNMIELDVVE
jgi:hypothetical protein